VAAAVTIYIDPGQIGNSRVLAAKVSQAKIYEGAQLADRSFSHSSTQAQTTPDARLLGSLRRSTAIGP